MYATDDQARHAEQTAQERTPAEAAIARDVLSRLGRPGGLHSVQVKPVWSGKYRVNVYVRADSASCRVAHSYFLEADGDGKVLASSPEICRAY